MIVDSKNIEFGYELISVIPYAYYLHTKGKLSGSVSGNDSDPLYYFSKNHSINKEERKFENINKIEYPNKWIHKPYLDKKYFKIPPYKEHFANDEFKFEKEIVVICNRANIEWNYKMINYFDVDTLRKLFDLLKDKYQIIYINVEGRKELYDGIIPESIGDFDLLKDYPKVINFHDLIKDSWNETQLKIFANCEKFITMNGGHSILASYFGGENIIMSKPGIVQARELEKEVNSFYTFYHEFNKSRSVHVSNENELLERVKLQWVDKEPIVNVLIRTSGRPEYFENCMNSIYKQTYKNVNVFVSIDNDQDKYYIKHKCYPVRVEKPTVKDRKITDDYGIQFPYNAYYKEMYNYIKSGIIIHLDDDDELSHTSTLQVIADEYKKGNDLIFWKVRIGERIIPEKEYFGKEPVVNHISGIGFAYDQEFKKDWKPYKRADYRQAKRLYKLIDNKVFLKNVLTQSQTNGNGFGLKIDKPNEMNKVEILFNNPPVGSKYIKGEVYELDVRLAKNYIIHGYAVPNEKKKVIKDKSEKVVTGTKKRGRPPKK